MDAIGFDGSTLRQAQCRLRSPQVGSTLRLRSLLRPTRRGFAGQVGSPQTLRRAPSTALRTSALAQGKWFDKLTTGRFDKLTTSWVRWFDFAHHKLGSF